MIFTENVGAFLDQLLGPPVSDESFAGPPSATNLAKTLTNNALARSPWDGRRAASSASPSAGNVNFREIRTFERLEAVRDGWPAERKDTEPREIANSKVPDEQMMDDLPAPTFLIAAIESYFQNFRMHIVGPSCLNI